jgi:hypothetical protein
MQRKGRGNKYVAMLCFAAVAMQANSSTTHERMATFDTDSEPIGVDNRCTGCISHPIEDFEGTLVDSNRSIKGFGGNKTANVKIGMIAWKWCSDKGKSHKFIIPKSFYVPSGNVHLLSPQHWRQTHKGHDKSKFGTRSETVSNKVTLFWNDQKNQLTIGKDGQCGNIHHGTRLLQVRSILCNHRPQL